MSGKPVAKILMGLLIFSFVGWGVADWIFNYTRSDNVLITVGEYEITVDQFNWEKNRAVSTLDDAEKKKIYSDNKYANEYYSEILTDMINDLLIQNRAKDMGFYVSDKRIADEIASYPEFQIEGNFSAFQFDVILNASGHTEASFAESIRNEMLRSMVMMAMNYPVKAPEFSVMAAYNSRYMEKDIEYIAVEYDDFDIDSPTDTQLQVYYKNNPIMLPEKRSVEYVLVSADLDKPDSYDAGYEKIIKAEDIIIGGGLFKDAAKAAGAKYVSIPEFAVNEKIKDEVLSSSIIAQVFAMDKGIESGIIETDKGFVIVKVTKINPAAAQDLKEVEDEIEDKWELNEQKKAAYLKANEILVDLNAGKEVDDMESETVTRTDGAPNDVLVAAYANSAGKNVIAPGREVYYVVSVKKEIMPKKDEKKLAAMQSEIDNMTTRGVFDDYNSYLIREYKVDFNTDEFKRMFSE